jgi:hypothetical protein
MQTPSLCLELMFHTNPVIPTGAERKRAEWRNLLCAVNRRSNVNISGQAFPEAFPEDTQLFPRSEADFGGEDVVLFSGDFFQQVAIDGD